MSGLTGWRGNLVHTFANELNKPAEEQALLDLDLKTSIHASANVGLARARPPTYETYRANDHGRDNATQRVEQTV